MSTWGICLFHIIEVSWGHCSLCSVIRADMVEIVSDFLGVSGERHELGWL